MLSDERLIEIEQRAQLFGCANGWTGTSGTLSLMIVELLRELKLCREIIENSCGERAKQVATKDSD